MNIMIFHHEVFKAPFRFQNDYYSCLIAARSAQYSYLAFQENVYRTIDTKMENIICKVDELWMEDIIPNGYYNEIIRKCQMKNERKVSVK